MITSNLPLPSMHSMIQHESHTAGTEFPMPFQWCTSFCATSTAWERTTVSCYFCPINAHHMQVKHYHTTHKLYDYSQIFDGISVVCVDLHEKYCIGRYFYILPLFYHFSKLHTGQMLPQLTLSRWLESHVQDLLSCTTPNTIKVLAPDVSSHQ